ncbi:YcxB family protein [Pasteurella skyensis]|uniref:YcxB family protein n=1 Tax=Phocoenobacter skyensis TaxID=97481 RepID=A0AAJ6N9Y6_9PAST|nr:YcxB family protein [Pasteurella skyensis]MDP8162904.1 YcxB family protein [Pasteurella skyensis]MDP8172944.1 YcxB family protein [Pasteurella skyensis]MDP8176609.1 YcxB family protein [Pasteurella skyensis]MDP8179444.1 YcxB family protein [Pasteurella skyensis]MDP8183514.1 YcxB family protein [Pasteurella skyensis]
MKEIEVEYMATLKDHLEAYTTYDKTTVFHKVDKVVAILLMLFGVSLGIYTFYIHLSDEFIIYAFLFILIGLLDFMGFLAIEKLIYIIRFKMTNKFQHIQKVRFSNAGIYYETNGIKSDIEWRFYNNFLESENTLMLIIGKKQYSVIPKSSFNEEDYIILRDFLVEEFSQRHIK